MSTAPPPLPYLDVIDSFGIRRTQQFFLIGRLHGAAEPGMFAWIQLNRGLDLTVRITAILKLSQLMRYMLYEANDPQVPLEQEVEYLRNYVDLQRLRLADDVDIEFSQEGQLGGRLIEPMLLIPFVENAFKHGVSYQHPSAIRIVLRVVGDELLFRVQNRRFEQGKALTAARDSGIGIQNVTQRLQLLYPHRHHLDIDQSGDQYIITLTLALHAQASLPVS